MASPADVGEVAAIRPDLSIPEQHVAAEDGKDVHYIAMSKASCQRLAYYLSQESWLRHQARRQRWLLAGHVTGYVVHPQRLWFNRRRSL